MSKNLKELRLELDDLKERQRRRRLDKEGLEYEIKNLDRQISAVHSKIKAGEKKASKNITITDHAIVRYIERVLGLDLDDIRSDILKEETKKQVKALGDGRFPIGNGAQAVVKDNTVVSVIK